MRDAVEAAFGPLLEVDATNDSHRHWRLQSTSPHGLLRVSVEELAELESAAASQDVGGLTERAEALRELARKLRAMNRSPSAETFRAELESLMQAEGLAMRPGPRTRLEPGVLALVRDAIKSTRVLEFDYVARSTGRLSRQRLEPYGVPYGARPYLVGRSDWTAGPRLWRLANMGNVRLTSDAFERDAAFDLRRRPLEPSSRLDRGCTGRNAGGDRCPPGLAGASRRSAPRTRCWGTRNHGRDASGSRY